MPDQEAVSQTAPSRRPLRQLVKRAVLALLFSSILIIPRIRRLRRRPRAWAMVRVAAALLGGWLVLRYAQTGGHAVHLLLGMAFVAFGLVVGARPEKKSVDAVARHFNALVVLNGGTFLDSLGGKPIFEVSIFVTADRFIVLDGREQLLAEIPLAAVREVSARSNPHPRDTGDKGKTWDLEIRWESGEVRTARFRYQGFFAEHLARVAQATILSVWKKELPVLK